MHPQPPSTTERFHALDGLRALAMLLGIYLHSVVSFVVGLPPHLWPIQDIHAHEGFGLVIVYIHAFRMPLFFMLAGFFGRMLHERLGSWHFLRHRFVRLVIPLVAGVLFILPLMHLVFLHGASVSGSSFPERCELGSISMSCPPTFSDHGPSLFHLWFIHYLILLTLLATGLRVLTDRVVSASALGRVDELMRWLVRSGWGVPVLALATLPVFYRMREWGIDTPYTLVPVPRILLLYGLFFGFGWLLQRQPELLSGLEPRAGRRVLLASVVLFPLLLALLGRGMQDHGDAPVLLKLAGVGVFSLFSWSLVLGFTGLALRYLHRPSATMRYLADSAYWMYLLHLPLVAYLQILFFQVQLPGLVKFLLISKLVVVLLLPGYEYLVRYTFIGRILNGPRARRAPIPSPTPGAVG